MMEIVVPERVNPITAFLRRPDEDCLLRLVLGDDDGRPPTRGLTDAACNGRKDMIVRRIVDVLRRVQPQSVEMKFINPVTGVGDEIFAHRPGVRPVEIDRGAPIGRVTVSEVILGEFPQVISIRPQMVVDNIKDHADSDRVSAINEASEIVRRAVEPRRRKEIHAVISPAEPSGKIGHRHDFDQGYSQAGKFIEFLHGRGPYAFAREGPDVHFVNDISA